MIRFALTLCLLVSCLHVALGQVVINELCSSNADVANDPDYFNFSPWIELYNKSSSSVNIGGFYLTDDPADRKKWMIPFGTSIPGKGYRTIWCDGVNTKLHSNFSLDNDGEEIVLSNQGGNEIDRVSFPEQYLNISFGRLTDGASEWGFLVNPTLGKSNRSESGIVQLSNPEFA